MREVKSSIRKYPRVWRLCAAISNAPNDLSGAKRGKLAVAGARVPAFGGDTVLSLPGLGGVPF